MCAVLMLGSVGGRVCQGRSSSGLAVAGADAGAPLPPGVLESDYELFRQAQEKAMQVLIQVSLRTRGGAAICPTSR